MSGIDGRGRSGAGFGTRALWYYPAAPSCEIGGSDDSSGGIESRQAPDIYECRKVLVVQLQGGNRWLCSRANDDGVPQQDFFS